MGPITAAGAIVGIYTSMLWLTGRNLKLTVSEAIKRRAERRRAAEALKREHPSARPMEF